MTHETVAAFVDQFPPRFRPEMLDALARTVFFDATELKRSVLDQAAGLDTAALDIVPLSANSGQLVRMVIEQEAKGRSSYSHLIFRKTLREALESEANHPIVLVDDNISSATQARAQFLRWVGIPRQDWPEECRDEDGIIDETLPAAQLDIFRTRPIFIVTCVGRPLAEQNLRPILSEHGFTQFCGVRCQHLAEGVVEWSQGLQEFLFDVGANLIAWSKYRNALSELEPSQVEYCKGKAFGYGNVGSLVATASNVPTATVTAIWSPGLYRGSPWMPLMIRRNKLRYMVFG